MSDNDPIPPPPNRDIPYPVFIREARYQGQYAGGRWTLVAGAYEPESQTEAWGQDGPCHSFWIDRSTDPTFTVPEGEYERECVAVAGSSPQDCIKQVREYYADD